MKGRDDILDLIEQRESEAFTESRKALVIQPGAVGDCILTLGLVRFLKDKLNIGSVEMIGHTDYISYFVGRSVVDGVRSIDSLSLHRMFEDHRSFDLEDDDPLLNVFGGYGWLVTFLNDGEGNFEQNLIYAANCMGPAEVTALEFKAGEGYRGHIAQFYVDSYMAENPDEDDGYKVDLSQILLRATGEDEKAGAKLLEGSDGEGKTVLIAPGSGGLEKCWAMENYLMMAEKFRENGAEVTFLLGPAECERYSSEQVGNLERGGKVLSGLSLGQVFAVLTQVDLFVGNDSGIGHLAGGMGVETVAVFGPTEPERYRPVGPRVKTVKLEGEEFKRSSSEAVNKVLNIINL